MRSRTFKLKPTLQLPQLLLVLTAAVILIRIALPYLHLNAMADLLIPALRVILGIAGLVAVIYLVTWMNSGSTEM